MNASAANIAQCPKCRTVLSAVSGTNERALFCSACGGIWLTTPLLHDLLRAAAAAAGVIRKGISLTETPARPSDFCCPECRATMLESLHFRAVEVERCPVCNGVFLDRGKLESIAVRFIDAEKQWGDEEHNWAELSRKLKLAASRQQQASRSNAGLFLGLIG